MQAWLNLRYADDKRARLFMDGVRKHGYHPQFGTPKDVGPSDIYVTWNRIGLSNRIANEFKQRGQKVLVAENSTWGNEFAGNRWYHIARDHHNTANCFDVFGPERWSALNVELQPFRTIGETVILPQRGIGSAPVVMPRAWPVLAKQKYKARLRKHPGKFTPNKTLEDDLANAARVVTWASGAAVKALMMGISVTSEYKHWIAAQDNTEEGRRSMFESLAWAQWTHDEIKNGFAFECLLT